MIKMYQDLTIERVNDNNFDDFISMIVKLANYEKKSPPDGEAKQRLKKDCLSKKPRFEAYLANIDNKYVAYVIFFMTYSSYLALPTLYLEDLFVLKNYRGKRIGQRLFRFCINKAKERNCGRMEWCVFNWNKSAINFYKKNNATRLNKTYYRLNRKQIMGISD